MPDIFPPPPKRPPNPGSPAEIDTDAASAGRAPAVSGGGGQSLFAPLDITYHEAGVSVATVWDYGYGCAPVAGPAASAVKFWRMRGVKAMRVATWAVATFGTPPRPPHWDMQDGGNSVLVGKSISAAMPTSMPDGSVIYHVAGQYTWVLQKAPADGDPIPIPLSLLQPTTGRVLNPAEFLKHIIGPVSPPSGYQGSPLQY